MADISQITLPSGTTYDIKDAVARAAQGNAKVFYGTCDTVAENVPKIIVCEDFTSTDLVDGTILFITFSNYNKTSSGTTTFNVNNTGNKEVYRLSSSATQKDWEPGETVGFIFSNDKWLLIEGGIASNSNYGEVRLLDSIDNTSSTDGGFAATPKAVKDALDAAKAYADGLDTGVSDVTVNGTSVVSSGVAALGTAAGKSVDTSIAASSTSTNLPTSAAVESRIQAAIAQAEVGSAAFQGVVNSNTDISGLSDYKKGWYWVVGTAGTYVGQTCEVGDFIFCVSDKASAYAAADFKVVQANIDMSQFGDLAFKDTATGSVSVTSSDAVTSVSHGLDSATTSGDDTVLKDVTNSAPLFTGTQKYLHLSTSKDTVTSTGTASVTTSGAVTAVSGSVNTTSTDGIDIKPAGTVSTPTITVTPSTTTKYVASSATGGGTVTNGTAATFTATVSNENLTFGWTANTPTAVTLPSFSSQTIATGITSATSTQPSFTGTQKYLHLSTTKDTVTSTGSISVTTSDAVTAVSGSVNTTASDGIDIKPAGSISVPILTKTYVKPKVTVIKGTTTSTGTVTVS